MEKSLDRKGRWRNKLVGFRVSPEEAEVIDNFVRLSGLTKQDYIIRRLTEKEVTVYGNPKVYRSLRGLMMEILEELRRLGTAGQVTDEMLYTIQMMTEIMGGMAEESEVLSEKTLFHSGCKEKVLDDNETVSDRAEVGNKGSSGGMSCQSKTDSMVSEEGVRTDHE